MSNSEDIVLSLANVRYKKQEGSLLLTKSRVGWSPEGTSDLVSNTVYNQIKSHRLSKEGSSKVQLQLVIQDGNTINFHFASQDAIQERKNVSDLLQKLIPKALPQMSNELEAKKTLLQNEDLYHLYKDMVVSGVITADEFWANRQNELELSSSQATGLPSAFLIDAEAITSCNAVKYSITKDDVDNIFRTYPTVQKKHAELVPDKMTDEEFWVQFFQSQKFHRNRLPHKDSGSGTSRGSGLFQECLSEDASGIQIDSLKSVCIPTNDEPFQETEDVQLATATNKQLVQRCNLHSTLVLNAIHTDVAISSKFQTTSTPETITLDLSIDSPHIIADTSPQPFYLLANELSQSSNNASCIQSSNPHFYSTMRHLLPGGTLISNDNLSRSASLSPSVTELLFRYQRSLAELLRHFWACFPVINQQLEQKVHRMAQCLQDWREKQLMELNSQVDPAEHYCLQSLATSINTALLRYQEWSSRQRPA